MAKSIFTAVMDEDSLGMELPLLETAQTRRRFMPREMANNVLAFSPQNQAKQNWDYWLLRHRLLPVVRFRFHPHSNAFRKSAPRGSRSYVAWRACDGMLLATTRGSGLVGT